MIQRTEERISYSKNVNLIGWLCLADGEQHSTLCVKSQGMFTKLLTACSKSNLAINHLRRLQWARKTWTNQVSKWVRGLNPLTTHLKCQSWARWHNYFAVVLQWWKVLKRLSRCLGKLLEHWTDTELKEDVCAKCRTLRAHETWVVSLSFLDLPLCRVSTNSTFHNALGRWDFAVGLIRLLFLVV